jgi:hypothetical protein
MKPEALPHKKSSRHTHEKGRMVAVTMTCAFLQLPLPAAPPFRPSRRFVHPSEQWWRRG